jgi:transcriptional regulator with XRE-family HTH domain
MSTKEATLKTFLVDLMQKQNKHCSALAAELGVSHATVGRWLSGHDTPNTFSCRRLAEYSGVPLKKVLSMAGHFPKIREQSPTDWPEFREYALYKYPEEFDEDLVATIENLIEWRRHKARVAARTHSS